MQIGQLSQLRPPALAACSRKGPSEPEVQAPAESVQLSGRSSPPKPDHHDLTAATAASAAGPVVGAALLAGLKTGFVQGYMTPSEVHEWALGLERRYPDLVELVERPYRTEGYDGKREDLRGPAPLYYLRIGPREAPDRDRKVGVLNFAAPHAREWCQPIGMVELTEQLLQNYDPDSTDPAVMRNTELVQKLDLYVMPMTNPDGTNYSMFDQKMWRKSRSVESSASGVDINRNYPYRWEPGNPSSDTYSGPGPLSEPETRHVVDLVDEHPNIRFACDWHSHAEEIRRPFGVSAEDKPFYDAMHDRMAGAIASVRGRQYETVVSEVISGSSDDYFYHQKGLYATIVEDAREFQPPVREALQVSREIAAGARELMHVALEYGQSEGDRSPRR